MAPLPSRACCFARLSWHEGAVLGVRGSLPVPGPRTERYGGNTSCVEARSAAGTRIIIDAGTGLRRLGREMMREEFESGRGTAHLLISHTHWDHIQGLPFFAPLHRSGQPTLCVCPPPGRRSPAGGVRVANRSTVSSDLADLADLARAGQGGPFRSASSTIQPPSRSPTSR
jgi:glyoxylase-like metal-dependent hydrolase (beta-lactamase superfamily II)